jgi:hypothetical protein
MATPQLSIAERSRRFLTDKCLVFLRRVLALWPASLTGITEEALYEAFRQMAAATPPFTDTEIGEMEDLFAQEWKESAEREDARLESLVTVVRNFVWLAEDNPFEEGGSSSQESGEESSSDSGEELSPTKVPVEGEDSGSDSDYSMDGRMFFITEFVLCADTLLPLKPLIKKEAALFKRENGLTPENFSAFRRILEANVRFLEGGVASSVVEKGEEKRVKQRKKIQ